MKHLNITSSILREFQNHFESANEICEKFYEPYQNLQLNIQDNLIEIFALNYTRSATASVKSISLLLEQSLYVQTIPICRNIFESFFNLRWVLSAKLPEEQKDRVFKLEAEPFGNFEKELANMELEFRKGDKTWKPDVLKTLRKMVEKDKREFPYLLEQNKKKFTVFKSPPPLTERMDDLRSKYYHVYRFTSFFVHANPRIKEYNTMKVSSIQTPLSLVGEPLIKTYTTSFLLQFQLLRVTESLLRNYIKDSIITQTPVVDSLCEIVDRIFLKYHGNGIREYM